MSILRTLWHKLPSRPSAPEQKSAEAIIADILHDKSAGAYREDFKRVREALKGLSRPEVETSPPAPDDATEFLQYLERLIASTEARLAELKTVTRR